MMLLPCSTHVNGQFCIFCINYIVYVEITSRLSLLLPSKYWLLLIVQNLSWVQSGMTHIQFRVYSGVEYSHGYSILSRLEYMSVYPHCATKFWHTVHKESHISIGNNVNDIVLCQLSDDRHADCRRETFGNNSTLKYKLWDLNIYYLLHYRRLNDAHLRTTKVSGHLLLGRSSLNGQTQTRERGVKHSLPPPLFLAEVH